MLVTFPHMGTLHIVLAAMLGGLGCQVLVPPPVSKRTLELGAQCSPETVCLPFKITLGSFIEALENGADTIVTCGGVGPCRLGYYAEVQRGILEGLGYKFELIAIEPDIWDVLKKLRYLAQGQTWPAIYRAFRLAGAKMNALDNLERRLHFVRAREQQPGVADLIWQQAMAQIQTANDVQTVAAAAACCEQQLHNVPTIEGGQPLRIGIVGEIFVMLEPFINLDITRCLGCLGVEVHKTMYLSDYVRGHIFHLPQYTKLHQRLESLARPYLGHYVGGHGLKTVGYTVELAQSSYDGVIQVFPFSCMPEVVAKNILPQVSQQAGIPVMSLAYDEQSGQAGVQTRLEAFVDLLRYRRLQHS